MKPQKLDPDEVTLVKLAQEYSSDDKARGLLESWRWPNGVECPHCKNSKDKPIYKLESNPKSKRPGRKGLYKCGACRMQFTVLVGTIFSDSHVPVSKWMMALFLMCSSKKAMSAHQLHRMLDVTYKTAWFMAHRLRYAMGPSMPLGKLLTGVVEVDETFVGGKGENKTKRIRHTPVVALVQRDGGMHVQVVADVTAKTLRRVIDFHVDKTAVINTDDSTIYRRKLKHFARHDVVNHTKKQYAVKMLDGTMKGINSCESFFSLLKRGVYGSFHHVSREHLPKYADEFSFRWNTRKDSDGKRMSKAVALTEGKRLTYRQVV